MTRVGTTPAVAVRPAASRELARPTHRSITRHSAIQVVSQKCLQPPHPALCHFYYWPLTPLDRRLWLRKITLSATFSLLATFVLLLRQPLGGLPPCNNTNNYTNYDGFQYIVYDTQALYQRSTLRDSEWLLYSQSDSSQMQKSPDHKVAMKVAQYRDMIGCGVDPSCPLIFSPLIEPEPPPVDLCNSLQVPPSGGHKYGTLYFSLRLLELMTELEMIGVLSQLVFNEHNGLALLWFLGSHRDT